MNVFRNILYTGTRKLMLVDEHRAMARTSEYADRISPRFLKNYIRPNFPELLSSSSSVYSLYLRRSDGVSVSETIRKLLGFRAPPAIRSLVLVIVSVDSIRAGNVQDGETVVLRERFLKCMG